MYRLAVAPLILALAPGAAPTAPVAGVAGLPVQAPAPPAAAEAAPFGGLPVQPVKDPARCLRATGAPGEVVRWAPQGAEFLQATASGFGAPVKIGLGDSFLECPIAKAQPTGAAVVIEEV